MVTQLTYYTICWVQFKYPVKKNTVSNNSTHLSMVYEAVSSGDVIHVFGSRRHVHCELVVVHRLRESRAHVQRRQQR